VNIEYNEAKAKSNLKKHGVTYTEAETALHDPSALCQEDSSSKGESRWVLLGMSN